MKPGHRSFWRILLLVSVSLSLACAHTPRSRTVAPPAPKEPRVALENESLGFRVEFPETWRFLAGGVGENIVARGDDRVLVRLFPEHFTSEPRPEECWSRLYERLPADLLTRPASPAELATVGPTGLSRLGGRRMHLAPFQRDESCMVLVVEGPEGGSAVSEVARTAFESFELTEPSPEMRTRLDFDAGTQLLELGEHATAMRRFESALELDPTLARAYLGAGLAASFSGDSEAPAAIAYLERYLELRREQTSMRRSPLDADHLRDALMHLGLAYATVKDYPKARARLGEFTNRFPEDPVGQYNFACALSLSGDVEVALYHLELAIDREPRLALHARTDEDLIPLHGLPEYERILQRAGTPSDQHETRR